MSEAVIVSTARTPIGKAFRGAFNMTHGATLGGHVVKHAVERAGIELGARDGGGDDVAGHRRAMRHVEGAAERLADRRAGGRNDDGVGHAGLPL